jgi:hypothetical protein
MKKRQDLGVDDYFADASKAALSANPWWEKRIP